MKASAAWCIVPLVLSACVSAGPLVPSASNKVGESPRLNEVAERSVGEAIYETYNYQQFESVKLTELAAVDVLAAPGFASWQRTTTGSGMSCFQGSCRRRR